MTAAREAVRIRVQPWFADHHFDGRYQEIAEAILDMLD